MLHLHLWTVAQQHADNLQALALHAGLKGDYKLLHIDSSCTCRSVLEELLCSRTQLTASGPCAAAFQLFPASATPQVQPQLCHCTQHRQLVK